MHPTRVVTFLGLSLLALAVLSGQALATTYAEVGSCAVPNPPAHSYTTIQAAVTATATATVIEICPGIYPEQVVITKKVTLEGVLSANEDAVVIVPPAAGLVQNTTDFDNGDFPIAAQILVKNTTALITISNLTVDGTGNLESGCAFDLQGITFQNASGTVSHVAVRNQTPGGPNSGQGGCQIGEGIFIETSAGKKSTVTIQSSSVHDYNKNGITANDTGTKVTLTADVIQGAGLVACSASSQGAAQNGFELGYGASGTIQSSTLVDNLYEYDPSVPNGACDYIAADILFVDTAEGGSSTPVKIVHNTVGNSQAPIVVFEANDDAPNYGGGVSITQNTVFGTPSGFDAIDVCTSGNTVTANTIVNSGESAVHLDASCGQAYGGPDTGKNNTVTGNNLLESACAGILDDWNGSGGNSYSSDNYYTIPYPVTDTTASCPFVPSAEPARSQAKARQVHKLSPKR
jgi:hypothetical protein